MSRFENLSADRQDWKLKAITMRTISLLLLTIYFSPFTSAQTPNQIINTVNERFEKINDYKADVTVTCNIPSIKIDPIKVKVIYKEPAKFKVKAAGILVLPKQNVNIFFETLKDTTAYTAVKTGEEIINGVKTQIINVIPMKDTADLILGKFWIDDARGLVLKSQLTTKSQGTILIENTYGAEVVYGLPDKMLFTIEMQKFKLPKAMALDLGTSSAKNESGSTADDGKGRITLSFSNYIVNKGVTAQDFEE